MFARGMAGQRPISPRHDFLPFGKPNFSDQEIAAVARVLRSGWVGMGPETLAFERELADYVGAPHVVTVNSCTSALFLLLLVSGVAQGDEVVCPSLTWCSTANAALYLGAKPVFCDVDPQALCPTVEHVLARVTPQTRAVMVVHFGGLATDVVALRKALPERVVIVEDAAHALGARFADGTRVGSSGNLTCFSFYANKNLSTGEGGAIALSDAAHAERLQSLRQHALPLDAWKRFTHPRSLLLSNPLGELGYKMNYTDLQASIGRVQLARQQDSTGSGSRSRPDTWTASRISCRRSPSSEIPPILTTRAPLRVLLPEGMEFARDDVLLFMRARNIGASIHYAPLHLMPLYAGSDQPIALPATERVAARILTLPISSSMTLDDADDVLAQFKAALKEHQWKPAVEVRTESPVTYGFRDRLKAEFPSQIIVDATEVCNLACIHCPHPTFKKSVQYGGRHLDPTLHQKMVDEVREHGRGHTQYIRYTSNGEPLVHPHIYDMLDYAVRSSGVFVTLTTNGTILNERRVEKLLASGLHLVDVSIDAFTPETYAKVRVNGKLDVTRGNVLRLLEIKRRARAATRVVVSFVEQPRTHEAGPFEAYWKDQGVDCVVVRRLHSAAEASRRSPGRCAPSRARSAATLPLPVGADPVEPARRAGVLPAGLGARLGDRRLPPDDDP
jgi:dTDP-4-amino-4,6-dideoxygalactose transaminase/uncharacterized Fe-S cluster-containing radical SAM superfamily protein